MLENIFTILGIGTIIGLFIRQYWFKIQLNKQIENNRHLQKELEKSNWKGNLQEAVNEVNKDIDSSPKSASDRMHDKGWIKSRRNE